MGLAVRTELAALVIHDLKNALGSLEAELADLAPAQGGRTQQAWRHCAELRQRFVMFLTLYDMQGRLRAQANDESPSELLRSLARPTAALPDPPPIHVATDDATPAFWYFDRHLVGLAMQAAMHNALRFARHEIVLGARQDGNFLVMSIDDDGPGLGSIDPSAHSTGLGTELCRAVARAHRHGDRHGRVTLADRPQGGARFELWLP